jgi:hypothetical protein
MPRQQIERLPGFRPRRDRQHRRKESDNSRRLLFVPPKEAALFAINNVAEMPLSGIPLEIAGDQPSVDKIARERRDRIIWILP